ncbi:hypothetical protein [Haloprofundus marisrubri]|uniref:hypothetical protein n=1 Tax=Haloprofundus marisrubri TaxID=1514971 RepID=UPI0012BA6145|nr:hypothetical protein [Haloprofundus marisrubri]
MPIELPTNEGAKFAVTLQRRGDNYSIVDDQRTHIEVPDGVDISSISPEKGLAIRDGSTGRALLTVTCVQESAGGSGHQYVQLLITQFREESFEEPPDDKNSPRIRSKITHRGGERDIAGPRSVSYGSKIASLTRKGR